MSTKHIPASILELAIVPEGSTIGQALQDTVKVAQHAEKLGYERIWFAEHHNMPHIASSATSIVIGHVAGKTEKIRVGSGGIMLPNHSPLIVTEQFGTLAALFPNRIDLGLGRAPGTDGATIEAISGEFFHRANSFPNNIKKIQAYLENCNENIAVRAFPGEGMDIPIWILGSSMDSAKLASEMGLPYAFASHFAPRYMFEAFEYYRKNFQPSKYLSAPKTLACINGFAADTNEHAEFLASSLYNMFLGLIRGTRRGLTAPVDLVRFYSAEEQVHVNRMLGGTFIGDKVTLEAQLRQFIMDSQVDELMFTNYVYDFDERLKSITYIKEVMDNINKG